MTDKKLKILVFGASGMVGQAVLRECLLDESVIEVTVAGRAPLEVKHPKLHHLVLKNLNKISDVGDQFKDYDACFFCLGLSAMGISEQAYTAINYTLPLEVGTYLSGLSGANKSMLFIYVSGTGTDSSEKGPIMWARVKGKTENHLMKLPFRGAYMFRPGVIIPMHGEKSRTGFYNFFYVLLSPFNKLMLKLFKTSVISTEEIARAMLRAAKSGSGNHVLESKDIKALANLTSLT